MCSKTKISCSSETAVLVIGMLSFSAAKKVKKAEKAEKENLNHCKKSLKMIIVL